MELISRKQAIAEGKTHYYTGIPCVHGHDFIRRIVGGCEECGRERSRVRRRKAYAADKGRILEQNANWRVSNQPRVKEIKRTYYEANKDKAYEQTKQRRLANPERDRQYKTKYREANRELVRLSSRMWKKNNPAKNAADVQARHAAKLRATPSWADLKAIEAFYIEAKRLEKQDGIKRNVDHIIPLRGKKVCGFHVQNNLQILTAKENQKKLNKYDD